MTVGQKLSRSKQIERKRVSPRTCSSVHILSPVGVLPNHCPASSVAVRVNALRVLSCLSPVLSFSLSLSLSLSSLLPLVCSRCCCSLSCSICCFWRDLSWSSCCCWRRERGREERDEGAAGGEREERYRLPQVSLLSLVSSLPLSLSLPPSSPCSPEG